MSLLDHLRELRTRLFRAAIAITLGMIVGYFLSRPIISLLQEPYCDLAREQAMKGANGVLPAGWKCGFVALKVTDPLLLTLKISLYAGLIVSAPFWFYQLWAFVAPGLHRNERRWAYVFAGLAAPLFAGGSVLAYIVVAKGLQFLLGFINNDTTFMLEAMAYVDFVTGMMLVFGVAFEFPLGIMLANIAGIVTGKKLLGWWRIAVFIFFLFAAIATPTADPFGMTFLALAMTVLYFAAVVFAMVNDKRRGRNQPSYAGIDDDEASSLDGYDVEPVEAASPIDGYDPIDAPTPVSAPSPVDRPRPLDQRYDDIT